MGLLMEYKLDEKLFRRYTKNSERVRLDECQFADDAALLAATREGAEVAMGTYARVATSFGLTVSYSKTKWMVAGREISESDTGPLRIGAEEVECVEEFPYLGSIITASGRVDTEVEIRITQASKAFGALRKPVFQDRNLSLHTKRVIYEACVLSVLLYGAECWIPLRKHLQKIDTFHHRCLRVIVGVSRHDQWTQHLTSQSLRCRWGNPAQLSLRITRRRLEWLGHIARMKSHRIPKQVLFGWLPQPRSPWWTTKKMERLD